MPITMDELVRTALDTAQHDFPRAPRVVEMRFQVGKDATGDDAVRIWVILHNGTTRGQIRHATLEPIAEQIRAAIRDGTQFRIDLIPYVYFRLQSEQDAIDAGAK